MTQAASMNQCATRKSPASHVAAKLLPAEALPEDKSPLPPLSPNLLVLNYKC